MASNNLGGDLVGNGMNTQINIFSSYKMWAILSVLSQVVSVVTLKYAALGCSSYFCWSLFYLYAAITVLIFSRVIFWNKALARGGLGEVYVFTALTPVLLLWLSNVVLNEKISPLSGVGTCIVVFAIYMQQRTGRKTP